MTVIVNMSIGGVACTIANSETLKMHIPMMATVYQYRLIGSLLVKKNHT